jgi:acylphosphatase
VVRRHVVVHGVVQGVGFRMFVARRAQARGVAGWVRNCADGSVEAVFEGDPPDVDALVAACADGPRGAGVSHVDVSDGEPERLRRFEIR